VSEEERRGVVFGFEVRSAQSFSYLREGTGEPLFVDNDDPGPCPDEEPLLRWVRRPDNPFEADLYDRGEDYLVRIADLGCFAVAPRAGRISAPTTGDRVRIEERLWGIPAALCLAERGDVPVHAAAVDVGGRALVFCGPSHFGKTTLAAAFLHAGHRVLSEDLTCCKLTPSPMVLPGPAMLRIRPDVFERLGPIAGTRTTLEERDRIHVAFDRERSGTGDPVPLAGIVVLRRGPQDLQLYRVEAMRFLPELFAMSFNLPSDVDRARGFSAALDLATAVPFWVLDRPLRFELLDDVIARIVETCLD